MDWKDLFGDEEEEEDNIEIKGLTHIKQALDHDQQMLLVNQLIEHGYFSNTNQAMCFGELPSYINWLIPWISTNHPTLFPREIMERQPLFDQAILNLYKKGQGIVSHVDLLRFEDGIIIISLLSSCVMTMRPANSNKKGYNQHQEQQDTLRRDILLRPGDILALSGEARYDWEHGIEEKLIDEIDGQIIERGTRISVTLRRLNE
ncbi:hypothetical protein K501DRAFT_264733 [Backusella circina FSU 941]|nr:hypothetical protein K501DRAFT_264733 [Backusella circina FSU 941]